MYKIQFSRIVKTKKKTHNTVSPFKSHFPVDDAISI